MELRRRALELLRLNDPAKKAAATRGLFDSRAALALDAGAAIEAPPSLPGRPLLPRLAPHTALARRSPFTREGSVGEQKGV